MLTRPFCILLAVLYCAGAASAGLLACLRDQCSRSVAGVIQLLELSEHRNDCRSFLAVTVTPAVSTVTVTSQQTVEATVTTTLVDTTVTEYDTVTTLVETSTTSTVTVTDFVARRDQDRGVRHYAVTCRPTHIPHYAASCSKPEQFSSACSCLGIHGTTITAPTPVTTVTVSPTLTQTSTATVDTTDYTTIDVTATSTLDVAATSTVSVTCASPSSLCGTSCVDISTDVNNCGACGNARQWANLLRQSHYPGFGPIVHDRRRMPDVPDLCNRHLLRIRLLTSGRLYEPDFTITVV
ncbi:lipase esterase family protein [Penicillium maclennaniae]|uniref:lipase esterase family protein n=1 Tax=Penicillium maclennaniae TaxID=1343394 RepID=UPI0025425B52|nr:lipase esterase family protein [Penicillium maclennaniae]KAJ5666154.1 lipase esterase family protein [Penicillium maclennaniae]